MRKRVQRRPFDTFKYILRKVILLLLAVIVAFPLLYMFSSSFFSPKDFNNLRLSQSLQDGATMPRPWVTGISAHLSSTP